MLKFILTIICFYLFICPTSANPKINSTSKSSKLNNDKLSIHDTITKFFYAYKSNRKDAKIIGSISLSIDSIIDLKNKIIELKIIKGRFIAIDESKIYETIYINSNSSNKKIAIKLVKNKNNAINAQLSLFKDLIWDKRDKKKQDVLLIANEKTNTITITQSNSKENSHIFKQKLYDQKYGFYASLNWSPGYAYRRLTYNTNESYAEQFQQREYKEQPLRIGTNISIKLGYILAYNHYLFAAYGKETMGFKTTKPSGYDWKQGIQDDEYNRINSFTFNSRFIGLGYKYVMFKQYEHIYPMLGTSIQYHWMAQQNEKNSNTLIMFHDNYWPTNFTSIKINAGIGITFTRFIHLAIEPYFTKNLSTYQGAVLSTRFMNFGINLGLEFRSKNKLKNQK
ncbi:MAG: hypothetical protein KA198_00590 [Chitinophagaceae bacterium]|nr:hypothetical protein [Chitinophagaceae bacterium]